MNKKKFLFVIDNLSTGGAQRQMVNLAVGLKKRGYFINIFCYAPGGLLAQPLYQEGIPIRWDLKKSRYSFDVILNLRRLLAKEHYDATLSFMPTPNFYLIMASALLGHRAPVFVSERSCDFPGWVSKKELFIRYLYSLTDHIIVNSHHQRIHLSNHYPAIRNRLSTIYNGYDINGFIPAFREPGNNPLKLLVIASVSRYKNGLCLIEALKILNDRYHFNPQVDWIGQRVRSGDRLAALNEMQDQIQTYHLENQWNWLDQRTDIIDQLHQHDVLVHPSYVEGLPNVVCEALACARPVIVSNVLDHPLLVQDKESGYLFNHLDPEDLAEKILLFDRLTTQERRQMGQCGRKFAEENLSIDRFVDAYEQLLNKK